MRLLNAVLYRSFFGLRLMVVMRAEIGIESASIRFRVPMHAKRRKGLMNRRIFTRSLGGATAVVLIATSAWAGGKNLQHYPKDMSMEDLIAEHDRIAQNTQLGLQYFIDEIARRDATRQTARIVNLTWAIAVMTAVMMAFTIVVALNA